MIVYYSLYFFVFISGVIQALETRLRPWVFWVVFLVLFFLCAARSPGIDNDYNTYAAIFARFFSDSEYFRLRNILFYEPSFFIIPTIAKVLAGSFYLPFSFAVFALFGVYFKLRSTYLSNSFFLSAILYVSSWYILHEFTQIRVGVASGLCLFGLQYVQKRKYPAFLTCILFACFFHYSAILYLVLLLVNTKNFSISAAFAVLGISFLIYALNINIGGYLGAVSPKMDLYTKLQRVGLNNRLNVWNYSFLANFFITSILILRWRYIVSKNCYFILMLKINIAALAIYLALSSVPVFAVRMSEMFGVVQYCLIPSLIYAFDRKIFGYCVCIAFSILNLLNFLAANRILQDYQFWFI